MLFGAVELGKGRPEVCTYVRPVVFAEVEHLGGEHATAVGGDERRVDMVIVDGGVTAPVGVWFLQGCRRPGLCCGP